MKDLKILKELRKGPLQSMKDDEYAMIEEQVTKMGIDGLNGYAKRMIEKGMREMAYAMKKATVEKHQVDTTKDHMALGLVMAQVAKTFKICLWTTKMNLHLA
jgi:hypothetical protein